METDKKRICRGRQPLMKRSPCAGGCLYRQSGSWLDNVYLIHHLMLLLLRQQVQQIQIRVRPFIFQLKPFRCDICPCRPAVAAAGGWTQRKVRTQGTAGTLRSAPHSEDTEQGSCLVSLHLYTRKKRATLAVKYAACESFTWIPQKDVSTL